MSARAGLALRALFGVLPLGAAACDLESPVDRGRNLYRDSSISEAAKPPFSCAFCHDATDGATDVLRPGYPMTNAARRPSYWGGDRRTLRDAANVCLQSFMLSRRIFQPDDPDWLALRRYIESLDDGAPAGPAPATLPRECSSCGDPTGCDNCAPDLSSGDPVAGEAVYGRACGYCHGRFGTPGKGAQVIGIPYFLRSAAGNVQLGGTAADDADNNRHHIAGKIRFGPFGPYGNPPSTSAVGVPADPLAPPAFVDPPPGTLFHLAYPSMPPFLKERLPQQDLTDLLSFLYMGPT